MEGSALNFCFKRNAFGLFYGMCTTHYLVINCNFCARSSLKISVYNCAVRCLHAKNQ